MINLCFINSQQAVTSAPMSLSLQCSQNPTSLSHHRKWREIRNLSNFPGGVKPLCHSRQICPKKWRQLSPNSQTSIRSAHAQATFCIDFLKLSKRNLTRKLEIICILTCAQPGSLFCVYCCIFHRLKDLAGFSGLKRNRTKDTARGP